MYSKIDHIGIAVRSLKDALRIYTTGFGLRAEHIEEIASQKTRIAMLPIGESRLELLEAMEEDSPVAKFVSKRGEGVHHICFRVEDVALEISRLKEAGVRMIDEVPRRGAGDCLVAFIHPSCTGGVLVELSEPVGDANAGCSGTEK